MFAYADVPDYLQASLTYAAGQFLKALRLARKRQMWDRDDELRDIIQRLFPPEEKPHIDKRHFGQENWSKWAAYLTAPLGPTAPSPLDDGAAAAAAPKAVPEDLEEEEEEGQRRKKSGGGGGGGKKKGKGGSKSRGGGKGRGNAAARPDCRDEAKWEAEEEAWLRWQTEEREKRERERERQLLMAFDRVDLTESQTPCTIQTTSHILDEWYVREEVRQAAAEETFAQLWLDQEAAWKEENDAAMRIKHPHPKHRSEPRRGLDPANVRRHSTERTCRRSSSRPYSSAYSSASSSRLSERRCYPTHHHHRRNNQSATFTANVPHANDRARMPPPYQPREKEPLWSPPPPPPQEEGAVEGEEPLPEKARREEAAAATREATTIRQHQVPLPFVPCI